jgi:hypothetical protein
MGYSGTILFPGHHTGKRFIRCPYILVLSWVCPKNSPKAPRIFFYRYERELNSSTKVLVYTLNTKFYKNPFIEIWVGRIGQADRQTDSTPAVCLHLVHIAETSGDSDSRKLVEISPVLFAPRLIQPLIVWLSRLTTAPWSTTSRSTHAYGKAQHKRPHSELCDLMRHNTTVRTQHHVRYLRFCRVVHRCQWQLRGYMTGRVLLSQGVYLDGC